MKVLIVLSILLLVSSGAYATDPACAASCRSEADSATAACFTDAQSNYDQCYNVYCPDDRTLCQESCQWIPDWDTRKPQCMGECASQFEVCRSGCGSDRAMAVYMCQQEKNHIYNLCVNSCP